MNTSKTQSGREAMSGKSTEAAADRVARDADAAIGKATADLSAAGQEARAKASELAEEAKRQVSDATRHATEQAKSFAQEQKASLSGRMDRLAEAADKVADEIKGDDADMARAMHALAGSVGSFGKSLREKDVEELIAMAGDFGRRQPATFMTAAVLAGFFASRFIKASAAPRGNTAYQHGGDGIEADAPGSVDGSAPTGGSARPTDRKPANEIGGRI